MTVTKDTKIFDILQESRETAPFFLEMGMHCLGCPSSQMESLKDAAFVHGLDPEKVVAAVNAALAD